MRKKLVLLCLASAILMACSCSLPAWINSTGVIPTASSMPATVPTENMALVPTVAPVVTESSVNNMTLVRLDPQNGDLISQITAEAPKAAALGQHMFVEFDASW